MSEQTAEAPEIVETVEEPKSETTSWLDRLIGEGLHTFKVSWANGDIGHVKARCLTEENGHHVFLGDGSNPFMRVMWMRPDSVRCIQRVDVVEEEPGQVEPERDLFRDAFIRLQSVVEDGSPEAIATVMRDTAHLTAEHSVMADPEPVPVRIDSLVPRVVDGELITVLHPHWYDGNPVTIVSLRFSAGDYVSVVFQLPGTGDRAAVGVPADFLVTPLPTA